jgi:hypothetical protein
MLRSLGMFLNEKKVRVHILGLCRQVEIPCRRHNANSKEEQRSARPGCECNAVALHQFRTFEEVSQDNNFLL